MESPGENADVGSASEKITVRRKRQHDAIITPEIQYKNDGFPETEVQVRRNNKHSPTKLDQSNRR